MVTHMIKSRNLKNSSSLLGSQYVLMLGVAMLLVAISLLAAPALAPPSVIGADATLAQAGSLLTSASMAPQGYADRIIDTMRKRTQAVPNDNNAWSSLGLAYQQKARETNDPTYYGQSDKALQKSLQLKPDDYNAIAGLGALNLSLHNFKLAREWGVKATALLPRKAYAYGVIGDAQIELGNYDQAIQAFQTMVDLRPDLSSYSRVSYARELYGDVPGALAAMEQAASAGGPAAENTAWTRVQVGNLYFNSNNMRQAENMYNQSLASYPNYLHAQAALAQVRWAQGKTDEAIELYKKSVANVPLPQYLTALGDIYTSIGDKKSAAVQYELVSYIYTIFEKNGVNVDRDKAGFFADHDMNLAGALQKAEAAALERRDVLTLDILAWARYKNGLYEAALKAEKDAMRIGTQNALFYYHLGMIQSKLGQSEEARKSVQKALSINPYFSILYSAQAAAFVKR